MDQELILKRTPTLTLDAPQMDDAPPMTIM